MKFLVIGLGSMGKRRIKNLQHLKAGEIIAFDPRPDRQEEARGKYKIKAFSTFEDSMAKDPDVLIISSPPHLHFSYISTAIESNKHFFTEVSWPTKLEDMDKIIRQCENKRIVAAPSCTMRFHPSIQTMKDLVDEETIGKVIYLSYHSGQYLPDWHPWEDYRSFYVSSKEMGGGREQVIFELDWIRWVMGEVRTVSGLVRKLSDLEIDTFDTYQMLLDFENGAIASVLVDLIQRDHNRYCKMMSEEGLIIWDWKSRGVRVFTAHDKKWTEYSEGTGYSGYLIEQMYIDEMESFIKAIKGETRYPHGFIEEKRLVEIVIAAEKSSEEGIHVDLSK